MSDTPKDVFGVPITIGARVYYIAYVAGATEKRFGTVVDMTDFGVYIQEEPHDSSRVQTFKPWTRAVDTRFMVVDPYHKDNPDEEHQEGALTS